MYFSLLLGFVEFFVIWELTVFEEGGIVRFFAASAVIERTGKYITVGLIFRGFEKSFD